MYMQPQVQDFNIEYPQIQPSNIPPPAQEQE